MDGGIEYVLSLKLSDVQAKLYQFYLNQESVALDDINKGKVVKQNEFLTIFQNIIFVQFYSSK